MSEFLNGIGLLCATVLAATAVTFGIRAGLELGHWVFGPFNINVNRGDQNIFVRGDNAASSPQEKT